MSVTRNLPRPTRALLGIVLATAAIAGCGGGGAGTESAVNTHPATTTAISTTEAPATAPATVTAPTSAPIPEPTSTDAAPTTAADIDPHAEPTAFRGVSLVDQLVVRAAPDGAEVASLPAMTAFGTPTVVGVLDQTPGWVQVLVPVRPNDLTGWVREADVRLEPVDAEIHIDIATRTLRLSENGEPAGEWPIAVGRPDRPTPTGTYFITDKLATGDAGSVWGAHAFGISAYSDVLDEFIGGIGQIGIHGNNDPGSIGNDVSSGCIRLPNEVIDELIDRLPVGTPVHIA
ncbi:L,D-transpeptidase family protein [Ilumatobacter sp.]|uniref:L,D-transpeptidase n=1 Tax=Ilumatobacter sp. TaxID=1967498 RepID=UPI003C38CAB2